MHDFDHKKIEKISLDLKNMELMRTSSNTLESRGLTVAQLALSEPGALSVFTKYNIDYCCGGNDTLEEACLHTGLNADKIRHEINEGLKSESRGTMRFSELSTNFLVEFICQNHHSYVKKAIPEIKALLDEICAAYGDDQIELLNIKDDFYDLAEALIDHMVREEFILFPAIKRLESQHCDDFPLVTTIQSPITEMEREHEFVGELLKSIRVLTNHYTPPDFASLPFRITYERLREFEADLMMCIHLENNVLFKRIKVEPVQ